MSQLPRTGQVSQSLILLLILNSFFSLLLQSYSFISEYLFFDYVCLHDIIESLIIEHFIIADCLVIVNLIALFMVSMLYAISSHFMRSYEYFLFPACLRFALSFHFTTPLLLVHFSFCLCNIYQEIIFIHPLLVNSMPYPTSPSPFSLSSLISSVSF